MRLYFIIALVVIAVIGIGITLYINNNLNGGGQILQSSYKEIVTKNQGSYIVKNMIYMDSSLDLTQIEKAMKSIRAECKKPCKINLYSNREAYDLDIMAGESSFDGFTDQQRNYLATHLLAFWGIDEGDVIEYYPSK